MLCAVFRLARYNILTDDQVPTKIFFGFPTTLAGGLLAIWMLLLLKYDPYIGPTAATSAAPSCSATRSTTPLAVWKYFPIAVVVARLPDGVAPADAQGRHDEEQARQRVLLILVVTGYICGFAMHYPEICFWMPTIWCVMFLIWGQASAKARAMYPPPLFPKKEPSRPQAAPAGRHRGHRPRRGAQRRATRLTRQGGLAQWESIGFASRGSGVRSPNPPRS